ncbi:MAG: trypsin-like peptidase domain-containing protein [Flavobacteriales bacterium]|nr:trypsin-like peptidase domain-containing protein [Flavobacteriales bacterium]
MQLSTPARKALFFPIVLFAFPLVAQIPHGGRPPSATRALPAPAGVRMPDVDVAALAAQDLINDLDKSIPYRFGYNHGADLDLANSGEWTTLEDGTRLWRLGIVCPGALSVNFEFNDFRPAPGAKVFVIDAWGEYIGAFTTENDHGEHVLGVQAMKGSQITIEYQVPATGPLGALRIGRVTHGYRDIFKFARALGTSGSCNNNVICPEGDGWRDQIRSVAMITVGGNGLCSGTLINNCSSNGTPYFLTANHCLPTDLNVSTWVFRFNWNSPSCAQNQNGPTNQTISGATLLARNAGSDVGLLQLNSTPPASYNVYYSGWDRSGATPTSQTCIHHPDGDVKKISFDTDPATQGTYGGAACWRIATWEDGTTEPGSSGAGLWDQNKRLIGQLYGGDANCSNNVNDYFGRLNVSFTNSSLQTWLGSCGNTVNGYDPNAPVVALDAQLNAITGATGNSCSASRTPQIIVRNGGTSTLTSFTVNWSVTNGPSGTIPWTGSLASTATVALSTGTITLPEGIGTFTATVTSPNGGTDQTAANNTATAAAVHGTIPVTLNLTTDRFGDETTWQVLNGTTVVASGGPYAQAASNGAYPQAAVTICVPAGCHQLVVSDSFGDGMCCSYGNGAFSLRDAQNTVLASGASFTFSSTNQFCATAPNQLRVAAQAFLEGPYINGQSLMTDSLRKAGLIPAQEPYNGLGFGNAGGETVSTAVLNTTGNNAIVDWVLLELRSGSPSYTVLARRSALLQRDGDIVDTDGTSAVLFAYAPGSYHVAVRHRNHLGAMTAAPVALSATAATVDFRSSTTATYGTQARRTIGTAQVFWAGDCVRDGNLLYSGSGNDRDAILSRIGGIVPTNTAVGYDVQDVNLDGITKYTGAANDRDYILSGIGGIVPTNIRAQQLP